MTTTALLLRPRLLRTPPPEPLKRRLKLPEPAPLLKPKLLETAPFALRRNGEPVERPSFER